jgi:hypothetical protein
LAEVAKIPSEIAEREKGREIKEDESTFAVFFRGLPRVGNACARPVQDFGQTSNARRLIT